MTRPITMPQQVTRLAPIGSLFKKPRGTPGQRASLGRSPRERDNNHLAAIRLCPCLSCGADPAGEAAHVRMTSAAFGKRKCGLSEKPDDRWTLPFCHDCHMEQHRLGELQFYFDLDLSPLLICERLYAVSPDLVKMRAVVFSFMAGRR